MLNRIISIVIIALMFIFFGWLLFFDAHITSTNEKDNRLLVENGSGLGSELYVPKNPRRVVFLNSSSFDIWVKLGGAKSVVGVAKFPSISESVYSHLEPNTVILPNFSSFSIEKIMFLKPDLVIMNGNEKRFELVNSFKQLNIPFMTLPSRSLEDIFVEIDILGKLIGKEDLAKKEITRIKTNIAKIQNKRKNLARKKAVLLIGTSESFFMATANSRQGEMLELAGGENILPAGDFSDKDKYVSFSLEYVAQKDPDVILFVNRTTSDKMSEKIKEALTQNPAWNTIKAVRENKIYMLPQELFSINPGLQADKAVEYLSNIFYKE